jgi:hypothetical protein
VIFLPGVVWRELFGTLDDDAISNGPAFAGLRRMRFDVAPPDVDLAENVMLALPAPGLQVTIMGVIHLGRAARSESLRALNEFVLAVERHAGAPT